MQWAQKRAHFSFFCTPNGLGSFLEKHIFDPLLTHFLSQNNPFSRHFVTLEGPKWLAMGSKWAHFTCLATPNGLGSFEEKHIFHLFLTHFLSQNNPFSWYFVTLEAGYHLRHSTGVYGDVRFPLRRGIKEGCPLSPTLFVLVYEAFH